MRLLEEIEKALTPDYFRDDFQRQMLRHDLGAVSKFTRVYADPALGKYIKREGLQVSDEAYERAYDSTSEVFIEQLRAQDEIKAYDEPIVYRKRVEGRIINDWESLIEYTHDMMDAVSPGSIEEEWVERVCAPIWRANHIINGGM